jgi:hypothetical protein
MEVVGYASRAAVTVLVHGPALWETAIVGFGGAAVGATAGIAGSFVLNRHERMQFHRVRLLTELLPALNTRFNECLELCGTTQPIDAAGLFEPAREIVFVATVASRRDSRRGQDVVQKISELEDVERGLRELTGKGLTWDDPQVQAQVEKRDDAISTGRTTARNYSYWLEARFGTAGPVTEPRSSVRRRTVSTPTPGRPAAPDDST